VPRQHSKRARREAEAIAHLRPGHHDQRTLRRHLVEIGHHLDLIVAVLQDVGFRIHLVGGVGVHRLMPGRNHATLLVEELDGLERPGRERLPLEALRI
jgi:hypothetical protein